MGSRGPHELTTTDSARTERPRRERDQPARSGDLSREQALLGLQRAAGNVATTWLLTRRRSDQTAVGEQRHASSADAAPAPTPPNAAPANTLGGRPAVQRPPRPAAPQPVAVLPAAAESPRQPVEPTAFSPRPVQHDVEPSTTATAVTAHTRTETDVVSRTYADLGRATSDVRRGPWRARGGRLEPSLDPASQPPRPPRADLAWIAGRSPGPRCNATSLRPPAEAGSASKCRI